MGGGALVGSKHMRENKFLSHRHGDESTVDWGGCGEGGAEGEGRGFVGAKADPSVVNYSSPYPAPK